MKQKVLAQAIALACFMYVSTGYAKSPDTNTAGDAADAAKAPAQTTGSNTQATTAPPAAARKGQELESIVVTAERRTENPQKVPTAVTVIDGEQLHSKAITRIADLANSTPAFTLDDNGATQNVNIRGIGVATNLPGVQPGVAVYRDGVFQPPILLGDSFYDIQSIEVLRGPQGTLAGNNSTGGAMYINTVSPAIGDSSGFAEVQGGSHAMRGFQGAIGIPAGQHFAFRVAANYQAHDSYFHSIGPAHTDAGKLDEKSVRLGALFQNGGFTATAKLERTVRNNGGLPEQAISGTTYAPWRPASTWDLNYDSPTLRKADATTFSLELRQKFANGTVLRYVGGYGDRSFHYIEDTDATVYAFAAPAVQVDAYARSRLATHEVNLISPDDAALKWIAGAYWQRERVDQASVVGVQDIFAGFDPNLMQPILINQQININTYPVKKVSGVFGNIKYNLTDALQWQVGARYSKGSTDQPSDSLQVNSETIPLYGVPMHPISTNSLSGNESDSAWTGKTSLNWQVNSGNMVYALAARGYKAGGINAGTSTFAPEYVWDYELGWKATALGGHLRSQVDVFYDNYKNFQYNLRDTTTGNYGIMNLGASVFKGVEVQIQAYLGSLRFNAGMAYVGSRLPTFTFVDESLFGAAYPGLAGTPYLPQCAPGQPAGCVDYTPFLRTSSNGKGLFAPQLTWNAGVEYEFDMASGWSVTPHINYGYVGRQFTAPTYSPATDVIHSRGLLSALVQIQSPGNTKFEIFGTNLTNKTYVSGRNGDNALFGAPREFGVRIRYDFH